MKTGDSSLDSVSFFAHGANVPERNTGCYIAPMRIIETIDENSLGTLSTITISSSNSEHPPSDSFENLLEWIKDKLPYDYYTICKSIKVCSSLISYNRAFDYRKYVEKLGKQWPRNFILLGDAMCTFNQQFGQGMTHARRQAKELGKIFEENSYLLKDISHMYNSRASLITDGCWISSTASDWQTATLKVIKTDQNGETKTYQRDETINKHQLQISLFIQFMQWYTFWIVKCASKSGKLSTEFIQVVNQLKHPLILFKPSTVLTVCYAALTNYFDLSKKYLLTRNFSIETSSIS
ncbi:hypothetical protein I4U23_022234 [Adineta vaga]|nr:hypothetical protein I4U23_022234 [Adineta vaga]